MHAAKCRFIRPEVDILNHLGVAHHALETWADGFAKYEMVDSSLAVSGRLARHNAHAVPST